MWELDRETWKLVGYVEDWSELGNKTMIYKPVFFFFRVAQTAFKTTL